MKYSLLALRINFCDIDYKSSKSGNVFKVLRFFSVFFNLNSIIKIIKNSDIKNRIEIKDQSRSLKIKLKIQLCKMKFCLQILLNLSNSKLIIKMLSTMFRALSSRLSVPKLLKARVF